MPNGGFLNSGAWAEVNPDDCPCKGHGWFLSDYDTYHQCPIHGKGTPHPEMNEDIPDDERGPQFDWAAHRLAMYRQAYASFRDGARRLGFEGDFKMACLNFVRKNEMSPSEWVRAAQYVMEMTDQQPIEAQKTPNPQIGTLTLRAYNGGKHTFQVLFCSGNEEEWNLILDRPLPMNWYKIETHLIVNGQLKIKGTPQHVYQDIESWYDNAVTIAPKG